MLRRVLLILLATAAMLGMAQNTVPGRLIWHARLAPAHLHERSAGVSWADSMLFCLTVPSEGSDSPEYGFEASYTLRRGDSIVTSGTFSDRYPAHNPGMSIKLCYREGRAFIEAGASGPKARIAVDFDAERHSPTLYNPSELKVRNLSLLADSIPAPRRVPEEVLDSLPALISRSEDPNIGLWNYLDRDNNANLAILAGTYTLATLPNGPDGYMIVYLGGAQQNKDAWTPGRIKAYLRRTPFANHYDLIWLDAYGRPAPPESYATVDAANGIMTLVFPLVETTLRFRNASN